LGAGVVPRSSRDDNHNQLGEDIGKYLVVEPGDIVFNKLRTWQGGLGASKYLGLVSPAYFVCRPKQNFDSTFLQYLLLSSTYLQELTRISKWQPPSQFDIGWEQLKLLPIVTPNLERQKAIADYLDRETTRIDALIEKKRRLIHLVSSRTSQFVGSVCSGTNAADFEHWNRVPLKSLFSFSKGKDAQRLSGEFVGNHQGPYPVYSGQTAGDAIFGQIDTFDFDLPDGAILVATVGAEAMSCRIISGRFSLSQNCALMIPRSGTNVFLPFIVGQLRDLFLEKRSEIPDHMQPSLRIEDLNRFYVQIPSLETQESIASLVDIKWSKTGVLLKSLDSQVEKLLERRSSIVTAAVTGDLEIPEVAA
jgi:type I restriction enzyme S subunit